MKILEDRLCLSGGGLQWSDPDALTNSNGYGGAPVIQPDGKLLLAGKVSTTSRSGSISFYAGLARYNLDGSLDTSFGNAGEVLGPTYASGGAQVSAALYPSTDPNGNAGKIIVSGVGPGFSIARFNASGTLDTSFGSNGIATANFGKKLRSAGGTYSVVIQPDGKVVALGQTADTAITELARFNPNGTLDPTFGTSGLLTGQAMDPDALLWQPADGKLIVVGEQPQTSMGTFTGLELARYNANGTLDTSFGSGGIVTTNSFRLAFSGAIYPRAGTANDGKFLVAGESSSSSDPGFELARYNSNGTLDSTFGSGGLETTQITASTDWAVGVAIQADGRIVAAGTGAFNTAVPTFALVRYNTEGSLDGTFGTGGIVTTLIGVKSVLYGDAGGVALQPDGDIVVTGSSYDGSKWNFAWARYLPSEPEIDSFTASPNPVASGSSTTLTASGITDANPNSTITQVAFYVQINGTNTLLGYGTESSPGVWTFTFTVNLAPGTYTLFAQAEDSYGVVGDPFALTLTVR